MTKLADKIHKLRNSGKTYKEISSILGCSNGTVCYHLGQNQKLKTLQRQRALRSKQNPLLKKIENFMRAGIYRKRTRIIPYSQYHILLYQKYYKFLNKNKQGTSTMFSLDELIQKIGDNPTCYLTGLPIDITKSSSYSLDHIMPSSRGGSNTLENLGICTRAANQAKNDMTLDEFINLCKLVLENNGYQIQKVTP